MPLRKIVKYIYYNTVRSYLPRKIGVYRGIPARRPRLFDVTDRDRTYEKELIDEIEKYVEEGDDCLLIGAGFGVSTVLTATVVGESGSVIAYEASAERLRCAEETIEMNGCTDIVELRQALVGSNVAVKGDASQAATRRPSRLPSCDVLVMDCEGAEKAIIEGLTEIPNTIIVETQDCFDVPTSEVVEALEEQTMDIVSITEDNPAMGIDIVVSKASDV